MEGQNRVRQHRSRRHVVHAVLTGASKIRRRFLEETGRAKSAHLCDGCARGSRLDARRDQRCDQSQYLGDRSDRSRRADEVCVPGRRHSEPARNGRDCRDRAARARRATLPELAHEQTRSQAVAALGEYPILPGIAPTSAGLPFPPASQLTNVSVADWAKLRAPISAEWHATFGSR